MDDDDQEIYSAPSEAAAKSSFAQIRQAFEQKNSVPIKVAKDGRHQTKDAKSPSPISPKPSFKPSTANKPMLFGKDAKPELPRKAATKVVKTSNSSSPPPLAAKTRGPSVASLQDQNKSNEPTRRKSERESMFPPSDVITSNGKNADVKKQPLKPINGMNLPLKPEQSIIQSLKGSFKQVALPPVGSGPPAKPAMVPEAMIVLDPASPVPIPEDDDDDGEIYDDVGGPDLPPPPSDMLRPVSMIPEMTEEDELSDEDEIRPRPSPLPPKLPTRVEHVPEEQEVYDDVAGNEPELEQDDVYEAI